MSEIPVTIKQNKIKINATISKRLRDKANHFSDGNFSNFVETAIAYYVGALEKEADGSKPKQPEKTEFEKLIQAYLQTSEGQDYIKKLQQKKNNPNTETIFKSDYARRDILE